MRDVYEFAKYFIKNGMDTSPNTFDGNMKLQKMLVFANAISIAKYNELLFSEDILAFKYGCVVEKVKLRYRNDYQGLKKDSEVFQPSFSEQEYDVLNLTTGIFGRVSAGTLSKVNHEFRFWIEPYANGMDSNSYHDKTKSVVNMFDYPDDMKTIRDVINAYQENQQHTSKQELINGVTFYYDGFELTDDLVQELSEFALSDEAEDDAYTICIDDGELVIC